VYCLLRDDGVRQAISAPGVVAELAELAADAEAHSRRHGFRSTPRPRQDSRRVRHGLMLEMCAGPWPAVYAATRELVWGSFPTLEECVAEVEAMGAHL